MTLVLPRAKERVTRWRSIANTLEGEIREGLWPPGAALPNVHELARRFGVNRHTVRQALQRVQELGLLSVEQGRGTFARAPRLDYRLGRRVRFSENVTDGAARSRRELLWIGVEPLGPAEAESLALPAGRPCWIFRMRATVDGAPFSTTLQVLETARFPGFDQVIRRTLSVTAALADFGVADYVRLSTHVSAVLPSEDERVAVGLAPGEPVLLTRGVDALPSGEPFHLAVTAFVGSRVELVVDDPS